MPKKPRSPRKKLKRQLRETHLKNLDELRTFLMNMIVFYAGESNSANELCAASETLAEGTEQLKNAIEEFLYSKM